MIQRHFPVGELGPTSVLIDHPGLDFRSDAGRAALDRLSQRLAAIPNVAEVRSASQPLGEREPPDANLEHVCDTVAQARPCRLVSDSRYISVYAPKADDRNHITRIDLVFKTDPFSDAEPAGARRHAPGRQGGERAGRAPRRGLGLGGHRVHGAGQ